jgi:methylated-DNA-[protein]-cysteine S-methyltransferase
MLNTLSGYFNSPIGPLTVSVDNNGIYDISFCKKGNKIESMKHPVLDDAFLQLNEYFAGKRKVFKLPLSIEGTDFQKKVWGSIYKIAFGKSMTYSQLAISVQSPKGFRAAASACGKNNIPIIIPCHRILGKNNLGGFSGGLDVKIKLLELEGINYSL